MQPPPTGSEDRPQDASHLDAFFTSIAPLAAGEEVIVALSGGPDSTALLRALARWVPRRGARLAAAHLDHGLDPGSAARARAAAALAADAGVPCVVERREVGGRRRRGESLEEAARRHRYDFLDRLRRRRGARWVATAHHRDDQAETVLLRLLYGSGPAGLAGIRPRVRPNGGDGPEWLVRPVLALSRQALHRLGAARSGPEPVDDPTNRDLRRPRNRVRHRLLPAMCRRDPAVPRRLAALADTARGAAEAVDRRLLDLLAPRPAPGGDGVAVERRTLAALPPELLAAALALLHRRAGAPHPPAGAARGELARQLAAGDRPGCDCGGGWRWQAQGALVVLHRRRRPTNRFTYTLEAPGELEIAELALRLRLERGRVEPWMFRGSPRRAGLDLPLAPGQRVTVRSRRPGDRLQPLGAAGHRRLKQVLIDRGVPRRQRDRLPLLCLGEDGRRLAWVPGVTIDESFRLPAAEGVAWIAELEPV